MDAFGLESESIDNGVHYEMTRSSGWGCAYGEATVLACSRMSFSQGVLAR